MRDGERKPDFSFARGFQGFCQFGQPTLPKKQTINKLFTSVPTTAGRKHSNTHARNTKHSLRSKERAYSAHPFPSESCCPRRWKWNRKPIPLSYLSYCPSAEVPKWYDGPIASCLALCRRTKRSPVPLYRFSEALQCRTRSGQRSPSPPSASSTPRAGLCWWSGDPAPK